MIKSEKNDKQKELDLNNDSSEDEGQKFIDLEFQSKLSKIDSYCETRNFSYDTIINNLDADFFEKYIRPNLNIKDFDIAKERSKLLIDMNRTSSKRNSEDMLNQAKFIESFNNKNDEKSFDVKDFECFLNGSLSNNIPERTCSENIQKK